MNRREWIKYLAVAIAMVVWVAYVIGRGDMMPDLYNMGPHERIRQEMRIW